MGQIKALHFYGHNVDVSYDNEPNSCPFCHNKITPRKHNGYLNNLGLEIIYLCSNSDCQRTFIGIYIKSGSYYELESVSIGNHKPRIFSDNIENLSYNFVEIYNQSLTSEYYNLKLISGIGYRKALEFLIKDYLISKKPENEVKIKNKFLGNCIKEDVENQNLKDIVERATWLGNDETHYVRVWENKDILDLKKLIDVAIHWIEMEFLTEQYIAEMP